MQPALPCVIYLHGFNSAPQSLKARTLGDYIRHHRLAVNYQVPALAAHPDAALASVAALIEAHAGAAMTLIGSSLGGFYATCLAERFGLPAVLINPAVRPWRLLRDYLGPNRNWYTGAGYELTRQHLQALESMAVAQITRPERYRVLLQTGDETLDYRQALQYYRGAGLQIEAGGSHGYDDFAGMIPRILQFAGVTDEPLKDRNDSL